MSINESEVNKLLPEARTLVNKIVEKNMADGFLFSAGTDTQIIAYEVVKYKPDIPCLTLAFKHGQPKKSFRLASYSIKNIYRMAFLI